MTLPSDGRSSKRFNAHLKSISTMSVLQDKSGVGANVTPTNAEALTQSYLPQPASFTIAERFRLDLKATDFHSEDPLINIRPLPVVPETVNRALDDDLTETVGGNLAKMPLPEGVKEVEVRDGDNQPVVVLYRPPVAPVKQLYIIEYHRVSMFKGRFGLGNIVGSQALAPSEELTLTVRTYKQTILEKSKSETILDAINKETSDDLQTHLEKETTNNNQVTTDITKNIVKGGGLTFTSPIKWLPIGGSASTNKTTNETLHTEREDNHKQFEKVMRQHIERAASRREVTIDTKERSLETIEEENTSKRVIKNINVGKTLNLVFRQMNQEHIVLRHLVDVEILFTDGITYERIPLNNLDEGLKRYVNDGVADKIRANLYVSYRNVFDYQGQHRPLIEAEQASIETGLPAELFPGVNPTDLPYPVVPFVAAHQTHGLTQWYMRVRPNAKSTYTLPIYTASDADSSFDIEVPGVLVSAQHYTLPTDGVFLEAVLGENTALDEISEKIQKEDLRTDTLNNDKVKLGIDLVNAATDKTDAYVKIFAPCCPDVNCGCGGQSNV